MNGAAVSRAPRELARRASGGLEVTLYWDASDNTTSVEVAQQASGEALAFEVASERALDAFYHPFAHFPIALADAPNPAVVNS